MRLNSGSIGHILLALVFVAPMVLTTSLSTPSLSAAPLTVGSCEAKGKSTCCTCGKEPGKPFLCHEGAKIGMHKCNTVGKVCPPNPHCNKSLQFE